MSGVWSLGFRVWGLGLRVSSSEGWLFKALIRILQGCAGVLGGFIGLGFSQA